MKRPASPGASVLVAMMGGLLVPGLSVKAGDLDPILQDILLQTPGDELVSVIVSLQDRVNITALNHELTDLLPAGQIIEARFGSTLGTYIGPQALGVAVTQE